MNRHALIYAAAVALLVASSAYAQRNLTDIPDPDPMLQLKALNVAEGFEINLFASDPDIAKPIQMNWDPAGRLWVASSSVYPQLAPGQVADDKIIVLEDTDRDGRADKRSVFAAGLLIPTGVAPGDGGAYVGNSTELIHLRDTDGDGEADQRRVVLSGFGTEDTHHIIHTFRWGPDSRLYFNQSIYIHSHIETPWGVRRLLAGGVWRFRPASLELDVYARGFINPWGHHFDAWGQSLGTDGAFGEGINYIFPGAQFVRAEGPHASRILHGLNPGQPKHCGIEILSGRHLPEDWRGTVIANDFRGNRVNRFVISEDRSGYASRQTGDVIWTDHVAFRPIDVKMGPDGAIYIADWYNPIIQHGEVDFRDPRRDHTHGRIWRITAKGRPLVKPPKLVGAPVMRLLDALKQPEDWTRQQARRVLAERGAAEVLPALARWLDALDRTDPQFEHHRLEGLWVYWSLASVNEPLLRSVLASSDHRARAAAVRVLSDWQADISNANELLAAAIADEHPRVRLEAVNALRVTNTAEAARLALAALEKPMDENIDFALWLTMRETQGMWLSRLDQQPQFFGPDVSKLVFALKSIDDPKAIASLARLWVDGRVAEADESQVLELIGSRGDGESLDLVLQKAMSVETPPRPWLDTLHRASLRGARPSNANRSQAWLAQLLSVSDPAIRAAASRLVGRWKIRGLSSRLASLTTDESANVRRAAMEGLALIGDAAAKKTLQNLAGEQNTLDVRADAVAALAIADVNAAAQLAVDVLADCDDGEEAAVIFDAIVAQQNGPGALTGALRDRQLPPAVALTGLRRLTMSGRKAPVFEEALQAAGGSTTAPQSLDEAQLAALIEQVQQQGDPHRGQAIYRRAELKCMDCHAIAGAGGLVGPDLSSLGASAPVDYLIESLVEPMKKIKEGYHVVNVTRTDGTVAAGVQVRRTQQELVLRDAGDNEVVIPLDGIAQEMILPVSLMPPMASTLRQDEFVDLIAFLSRLGKSGEFNAPNARLVRRWRVLQDSRETSALLRANSTAYATSDDPLMEWTPAYSDVAGRLPADALPPIRYFFGRAFSFARFDLDVTTSGEIALRIREPRGINLWVNDQRIEQTNETTILDLPSGRHRMTLVIDVDERGAHPLEVELRDVPGSSAQAQIINGK